MDPIVLLGDLHGKALRLLSLHSGQHYEGLGKAVRHNRLQGKLRNQLVNIENAVNYNRHVTEALCNNILTELTVALNGEQKENDDKVKADAVAKKESEDEATEAANNQENEDNMLADKRYVHAEADAPAHTQDIVENSVQMTTTISKTMDKKRRKKSKPQQSDYYREILAHLREEYPTYTEDELHSVLLNFGIAIDILDPTGKGFKYNVKHYFWPGSCFSET